MLQHRDRVSRAAQDRSLPWWMGTTTRFHFQTIVSSAVASLSIFGIIPTQVLFLLLVRPCRWRYSEMKHSRRVVKGGRHMHYLETTPRLTLFSEPFPLVFTLLKLSALDAEHSTIIISMDFKSSIAPTQQTLSNHYVVVDWWASILTRQLTFEHFRGDRLRGKHFHKVAYIRTFQLHVYVYIIRETQQTQFRATEVKSSPSLSI